MTSSATTTVNPTVNLSDDVALALGTTLSVLMAVGLLGNLSAICVYMSSRRLRLPQNVFVVSLAVTDCVMVLSAAIVIVNLHSSVLHQSTGACLAIVLAFRLASSLGMVTIAAIGVVRYLSIVHPKSRAAVFTWARCVTGVVAVWLYATFLTSLMFLPGVSSYAYNPRMFLCLMKHTNQAYNISTVIFIYVLSVLLLAYSYSRIYVTVRQSRRRIHTTSVVSTVSGRLNGDARKKEWLRMADETRLAIQLMFIFVVFVVCWSPYLLTSALVHGVLHSSLPQSVYNFFLVSIVFNSAVNPIIYLCYNRVYREELRNLFLLIWCYYCSRRPHTSVATPPPMQEGCPTNVVGVSTGREGVAASVPASVPCADDFRLQVVSNSLRFSDNSSQRANCQSPSIECENLEPCAGQSPFFQQGRARKRGAGEEDEGQNQKDFSSIVRQEAILRRHRWRKPQSVNIVVPS